MSARNLVVGAGRFFLVGGTFVGAVGCAETTSDQAVWYPQQAEVHPPVAAEGAVSGSATAAPSVQGDAAAAQEEIAETDPSAIADAQAPLEPYGVWWEDAYYGTVWTPHVTVVGSEFTPYVSSGRWTYGSDYVWVSDYEWGWLPFHYGRWIYISGRGWSWIPGRVYRGAWVTWRVGGDGYEYVGWAPMAPTWYWRGGYAHGLHSSPPVAYVFCPTAHVFSPGVHTHLVTGSQAASIGASTRPFVAATPSVGGTDRTLATPTVGRTNSSAPGSAGGAGGPPGPGGMGGSGPAGGATAGALGAITSPHPASLGIKAEHIVAPPSGHAGLARAETFSRPSLSGPSSTTSAEGRWQRPPVAFESPSGPSHVPSPGPSMHVPPTRFSTSPSSPPVSSPSPMFRPSAPVPAPAPMYRPQPSAPAPVYRPATPMTPTYRPAQPTQPSYSPPPSFHPPSTPPVSSPSVTRPSRPKRGR